MREFDFLRVTPPSVSAVITHGLRWGRKEQARLLEGGRDKDGVGHWDLYQ